MASTSLSFSISRFTYVPNEQFPTIEAAFSAKPLADWILVPPHASFTLVIDQTSDRVIMKCLDGQDARSTWDLSSIKRETANDSGRHIVIIKFPHIVFRWYNRQDQILRRIQFRLLHRHEFNALTNFCIQHFGVHAVRDLYHSEGTNSSGNSFTSNISKTSPSYTRATTFLSSPLGPGRSSQVNAMQSSPPDWIPSSTQPASVSRMLSQAEDMSGVRAMTVRDNTMTPSFTSPMGPGRPSTPATTGYGSHSNRIPSSPQPNWISNSARPPSMSRMLSQAEGTTRDIPSTPVSRTDGMSRAVFTDRANTTLQAVEEGSKDWDGELTEEMMLSLIADDSFMAEVIQVSELWNKLGINRRLFNRDT